jgi:hypothetical protein
MNVTLRSTALVAAGVVAVVTLSADAQPRRGRSAFEAPYNPRTEVTLKGTIHEVKQMPDVETVTHVLFHTSDHRSHEVHVGPTSWLGRQAMTFQVGDEIEVTGSHVMYGGADVIVARQIRKGDQTLTLRDTQGVSRWSQAR